MVVFSSKMSTKELSADLYVMNTRKGHGEGSIIYKINIL